MKLRIIAVSPKYQLNAGYMARVCKNFGVSSLSFVKPRANLKGMKAITFAKHGVDLLENAKVYDSLEDASVGCDIVVGTTGIVRDDERLMYYTPKDAIAKISRMHGNDAEVALVIGRDDTGLNREEIEYCDIILNIKAGKEYPILNITHALAILLYAFSDGIGSHFVNAKEEAAHEEEVRMLFSVFDRMVDGKKRKVRNPRSVKNIFRRMVRKAHLGRQELHGMITAIKQAP